MGGTWRQRHTPQGLGTREYSPFPKSVRERDRQGTKFMFSGPGHTFESVVSLQPHGQSGVRREDPWIGGESLDWSLGGFLRHQECLWSHSWPPGSDRGLCHHRGWVAVEGESKTSRQAGTHPNTHSPAPGACCWEL